MQDDEISLFNTCTDLVSLEKREDFPLHLLQDKQPGEWVCVREFALQIGVDPGDSTPELFANWFPDPMSHADYVVILFYDDESKWSMAAHYNRARLLGGGSKNEALQATDTDNGVGNRSTEKRIGVS